MAEIEIRQIEDLYRRFAEKFIHNFYGAQFFMTPIKIVRNECWNIQLRIDFFPLAKLRKKLMLKVFIVC